jgi:Icc-related predicted phosphoesterase
MIMNKFFLYIAALLSTINVCAQNGDAATANKMRLAVICDPQIGYGGGDVEIDAARFALAIRQVNDLKPDAVIIAGDFVSKFEDKSVAAFLRELKNLKPPVILTPGNHDIPDPVTDAKIKTYRKTFGSDFVTRKVKGRMIISANSQLWVEAPEKEVVKHDKKLTAALKAAKKKNLPVIMLSHIPQNSVKNSAALATLFKDNGVFLCLAGHIHKTIVGDIGGIPLLVGEKLSHNHDHRPLGFRMMTFNDDNTYTWDFIRVKSPLDAIREFNCNVCGGLQKVE